MNEKFTRKWISLIHDQFIGIWAKIEIAKGVVVVQGCYGVQSTKKCHLSTLGAINDVEKNQLTHKAAADIFLTVIH
jgi:hypothetical protein